MADAPWEEIEHTADVAIRARGVTLADLFANAALGMVSLVVAASKPPRDTRIRAVSLEAPDLETLLVDWLSELAYMIEGEGFVVNKIDTITIEGHDLRAEVSGGVGGDLQKHIKAVTYHDLSIDHTERGYEATIVFDV